MTSRRLSAHKQSQIHGYNLEQAHRTLEFAEIDLKIAIEMATQNFSFVCCSIMEKNH